MKPSLILIWFAHIISRIYLLSIFKVCLQSQEMNEKIMKYMKYMITNKFPKVENMIKIKALKFILDHLRSSLGCLGYSKTLQKHCELTWSLKITQIFKNQQIRRVIRKQYQKFSSFGFSIIEIRLRLVKNDEF